MLSPLEHENLFSGITVFCISSSLYLFLPLLPCSPVFPISSSFLLRCFVSYLLSQSVTHVLLTHGLYSFYHVYQILLLGRSLLAAKILPLRPATSTLLFAEPGLHPGAVIVSSLCVFVSFPRRLFLPLLV